MPYLFLVMTQKKSISIKFILGNMLQALQVIALLWIIYFFQDFWQCVVWGFIWIYLAPPFFVRIIYFVGGRPEGRMSPANNRFWIWYVGVQLQSIYLRFLFLEEFLRLFPLVYSAWLRLWGARLGRGIYWAPKVCILDRTHLRIDDFVMVGYGVNITGHLLNRVSEGVSGTMNSAMNRGMNSTMNSDQSGEMELILASPHVESNVILGGLSGLGPGVVVCKGEMLPSTMELAPFYTWKNGRRHAAK